MKKPRYDDAQALPPEMCLMAGCTSAVRTDAPPVPLCSGHAVAVFLWVRDTVNAPPIERPESSVARVALLGPEPPRDLNGKCADDSVVYYLRFGDRIKIGTTWRLKQRLAELPCDELLATEPGDLRLERLRHQQFEADRLIGEWFAPSDDLLSHVAMLASK